MSGEESAAPEPCLPALNARTKLRDLLQQNVTCAGHFAGGYSLPANAPLPVLSFRRNADSRRCETLRLPVDKAWPHTSPVHRRNLRSTLKGAAAAAATAAPTCISRLT